MCVCLHACVCVCVCECVCVCVVKHQYQFLSTLQCANEKSVECAHELQMLKLEMMGEAAGQKGNSLFSEVRLITTVFLQPVHLFCQIVDQSWHCSCCRMRSTDLHVLQLL